MFYYLLIITAQFTKTILLQQHQHKYWGSNLPNRKINIRIKSIKKNVDHRFVFCLFILRYDQNILTNFNTICQYWKLYIGGGSVVMVLRYLARHQVPYLSNWWLSHRSDTCTPAHRGCPNQNINARPHQAGIVNDQAYIQKT